MSLNLQTTTATIDENGELRNLEKLDSLCSHVVQIAVITSNDPEYDDSALTLQQWQHGLSVLMATDFTDDPEEDIYTREDGKPYDASQSRNF